MKKLVLRLLVLILSVYVAGKVLPLLASSTHAPPPPSAPAPAPAPVPPSAPGQLDTKLTAPPPAAPRDYGDHGCCGGGPPTPAAPPKPGEAALEGFEKIGQLYNDKGDEAKKKVDAAYAAAEQAAFAKLRAKYNADQILGPLDTANKRIEAIQGTEKKQGELAEAKSYAKHCKDQVDYYQKQYDQDLIISKTVYYEPLQEAKAKLKAAENAVADKLEELNGRKSQKRFLEEQKKQKLAGYEQEAAQLKSALAASKAKHYAAINQLVRKAKANASAKFLGAKVPEGATSSYDIEAYNPPPVSAIVNEVLPGK